MTKVHKLCVRLLWVGLATIWAGSFTACSKDSFSRRESQVLATPYTEQQNYAEVDVTTLTIHLGEVPIYGRKKAIFKLENPTNEVVEINEVAYTEKVGGDWGTPVYPATLKGGGSGYLEIIYAPNQEGSHALTAELRSSAANRVVVLHVLATAVYRGTPDIDISYEGYLTGPSPTDCDATSTCRVPSTTPLKFGNIGIGATGTARLIVRNTATCEPYPGAEACTSCALVVDKNPQGHNIGIGFKPGTNDAGVFSIAGSTGLPRTVWQRDLNCEGSRDGQANGPINILVNFTAPVQEGEYRTTLVIESSDKDEPVIEVPVVAYARNAPVAVAKLRAFDSTNPSAPWSDPNRLLVLNRVYFDGRDSYDPRDPTNKSLITQYTWSVSSAPQGVNPSDYAMQGQGTGLFSFWAPLAGDYVVKLEVTNRDGLRSGATEFSSVQFHVAPGSRLHVELTWDDAVNDQDLHLTAASVSDTLCSPSDCHWTNCNPSDFNRPIWYSQDAAGQGSNPRLDIDDTDGAGPENINIDNPRPGTFRIYVHYWGGGSRATRDTVRVWLNGVLQAEYRRTLRAPNDIWAVGDIVWQSDGSAEVTPYPSDRTGEVGAIKSMSGCFSSFTF
jgi:hypothetical protein